jgi:hypothetical protein
VFELRQRLCATGQVLVEAFEVVGGLPAGYQFAVLGDAEREPLELVAELYSRMRRGLGERSLEEGEWGPHLRHPGPIRGRILPIANGMPDAEPRLAIPEITSLLDLAGVAASVGEAERVMMLNAMRKAAEKRVAGVSENKRRRHYEHAATLALTCVRIDPGGSTAWMRRFATSTGGTRRCSSKLAGRR